MHVASHSRLSVCPVCHDFGDTTVCSTPSLRVILDFRTHVSSSMLIQSLACRRLSGMFHPDKASSLEKIAADEVQSLLNECGQFVRDIKADQC